MGGGLRRTWFGSLNFALEPMSEGQATSAFGGFFSVMDGVVNLPLWIEMNARLSFFKLETQLLPSAWW